MGSARQTGGRQVTRRVLISGATGYVGTALTTLLSKRNDLTVRTFDTQHFGNSIEDLPNIEHVKGDITQYQDVKAAMEGVTDVIHLAAIVTDDLVDLNRSYGRTVNVDATKALLYEAEYQKVERFIYASSSSVYGLAARNNEAGPDEETPPEPQTAYASQKLEAERHVVTGDWDIPMRVAIRSATCMGPAPRTRLDVVVNIFSSQAWFNHEITVHGGNQYRSNIHVEDVAGLYALMLDAPAEKIDGQVFNATKDNRMVGDIAVVVASELKRLYGRHADVIITEVEDVRSYRLDPSKLQRVLGWKPFWTLEDAIRDNFAFFEEGGITDPDDAIYRNNDRMRDTVLAG